MPDRLPRPSRVREVSVEVPGALVRSGFNLNDIVRQIIWDLENANDWSQGDTARHLGVSQQTLSSFMKEPAEDDEKSGGMSLHTLSRIVASQGSQSTPITFFAKHPLYRGRAPQTADSLAYDSLCALVTGSQAAELARVVEVMIDRRAFDEFLRNQQAVLGLRTQVPSRSRSKSRRHKNSG